MLESELNGKLNKEERLYLEKISTSAGRMQQLIQDILQFSRLAQPESFREVELSEIIRQALADAEVRIAETGAQVETASLPAIEAIPSQMGQLFSNLVGNALKYTKPGVTPHLRIWAEEITGAGLSERELELLRYHNVTLSAGEWANAPFCRVHVADNGIGFEEEYATRIFAIFQRLHGRDAYEGTGIGLAVCKKIADNHHGLISARGVPGDGATFTVTLPLNQDLFIHRTASAVAAGLAAGVSA
jgi:light-regulated signal transduction histidine kinase (bacteriophytochrome)